MSARVVEAPPDAAENKLSQFDSQVHAELIS